MKNKMRALILFVALGSLGISPAWTQQQSEAKDGKTKCACCEHKAYGDMNDKKDTTQLSGSAACCQEMKKPGAPCCGTGEAKTDSGKNAKTAYCKEAKMDCCKETASCCAAKEAKMCQSKEDCCAESGQCRSAKATTRAAD